MSISFSEIGDVRHPLVHMEVDAQAGVSQAQKKTLIISPTMEIGRLYGSDPRGRIDPCVSESDAIDKYGQGSPAHLAAKEYLAQDPLGPLYISALKNFGTQQTKTITFGAAATGSGNVYLYIGKESSLTVSISSGDAVAVQAEAARDAINGTAESLTSGNMDVGQLYEITAHDSLNFVTYGAADTNVGTVFVCDTAGGTLTSLDTVKPINTNYWCFATFAAGVVTCTAKVAGNHDYASFLFYNIADQPLPDGVTIAVADGVPGVNGADFTNAIDTMADNPYDYILAVQYDDDDLVELNTEIARRWTSALQIYGHAWYGYNDGASGGLHYAQLLNTEHLTIVTAENARASGYQFAANYMGACAKALKADPARPCQTLEMIGMYASFGNDIFTNTEREIFLFNGMATFTQNDAGSQCWVERSVTQYVTDAYGGADTTWLDVQTVYSIMQLMRELKSMLQSKYPRCKLVDNGTPVEPGSAKVTADMVKGSIIAQYIDHIKRGLVEKMDEFKTNLVVERSTTDLNRLDIFYPPNLANQLRIIAAKVAFKL